MDGALLQLKIGRVSERSWPGECFGRFRLTLGIRMATWAGRPVQQDVRDPNAVHFVRAL